MFYPHLRLKIFKPNEKKQLTKYRLMSYNFYKLIILVCKSCPVRLLYDGALRF